MLPLNDTEPNRYDSFPYATVALIMLNCVVFGLELMLRVDSPDAFRVLITLFGAVPAWTLAQAGGGALAAVSSVFLHGSWTHLLGNMLPLWVFGRRVEDACGGWRFLLYYFTCAAFAVAWSTFIHAGSSIPTIGASGAIFGLMGAYLLLFPGGRIRILLLVTILPVTFRLQAFWVVLYFLAVQVIPAMQILLQGADYNIAYWAHLGGFFSAAFIIFFLRPEAFERFLNGTSI